MCCGDMSARIVSQRNVGIIEIDRNKNLLVEEVQFTFTSQRKF